MLEEKLLNFALLGAGWVLWLLVILSLVCIAVAAERAIFFFANRTPPDSVQKLLGEFYSSGNPTNLKTGLGELKGIEARVLHAGISAAIEGGTGAAEEAIAGTMTFEKLRMERGLIVLGTTGANAPFVGLFGTVLGIIKAFNELSLESAEAAAGVMAGISEALVATAIGLLVAIPAVVLYNVFQRRNKDTLSRLESLGHLMLSRLKVTDGDAEAQHAKGA